MNQLARKLTVTMGVAALLGTAPLAAHDLGHANEAYVGDAVGHLLTDGFGNCVQTGSWSSDSDIVDCGAAPAKTAAVEPAPAPKPEPVAKAVVSALTLSGSALFGFDSNRLSGDGQAALDQLVTKLKAMDSVENVHIVGHTDSQGPAAYNHTLSERRAATVKAYLVSRGINSTAITTEGAGENAPVAANATAEGRAQNRRVEIRIKGTQTH